jgi:hypothetical protein
VETGGHERRREDFDDDDEAGEGEGHCCTVACRATDWRESGEVSASRRDAWSLR